MVYATALLSVCLSVRPSVCLSVCVFITLAKHLTVWPPHTSIILVFYRQTLVDNDDRIVPRGEAVSLTW